MNTIPENFVEFYILKMLKKNCVSLPLCCFVVYSTRQFVLSFAYCYFVRVFQSFEHCDYLPWEERANLSAFRMFVQFALVWFCLFPLPLDVWEGLWLVIVALPGLFLPFSMILPFFIKSLCMSEQLRTTFVQLFLCERQFDLSKTNA